MPAKYLVLRDTREHEGHGWVFPGTDACAGTEVRTLHTGDYSLEGYYENRTFVIERKGSVTEFVGNLTTKEKWDDFKNELGRLEEFAHPFVLCEFPIDLLQSYPVGSGIPRHLQARVKVRPQFLLKRLEEIWLHFKTKFIFAGTPGLGRDIASGLFKRVLEMYP